MEVVSLCPFPAATALYEPEPGRWALAVCVKGTLALDPFSEASIAPLQEAIGPDRYFSDRASGSLYAPADRVPLKPLVDVLLVGTARTPGEVEVETLRVGLSVGALSKSLRVVGDRRWTSGAHGLVAGGPEPFTSLPLRYERAAMSAENPVGVSLLAPPVRDARALPNLELAGGARTAGFGPISPTWPGRRGLLADDEASSWAHGFLERGASTGPAPPGFNYAFFNAAPLDQQLSELPRGARIVLEHMHHAFPRLESRLPDLVVRVRFAPDGGRPADVPVWCDTLWINADKLRAVMTWRGTIALDHPRCEGRIIVSIDVPLRGAAAVAHAPSGDDELTGDDVPTSDDITTGIDRDDTTITSEALTEPEPEVGSRTVTLSGSSPPLGRTLPFVLGSAPPAPPLSPHVEEALSSTMPLDVSLLPRPALPFAPAAPAPEPPPDDDIERTLSGTVQLEAGAPPPGPALPFQRARRSGDADKTITLTEDRRPPMPGSALPFAAPEPQPAPQPAPLPPPPAPVFVAPPEPARVEPPAPPAAGEAAPALLLPVERYAAIKAELWKGGAPRAEILARHGLTEVAWLEQERRQAEALAREEAQGKGDRALALRAALAGEGGDEPVDERSLVEYASLRVALEAADDPAPILAARGLSMAAWRRLDAHIRRLAQADPALRGSLRQRLQEARAARAR